MALALGGRTVNELKEVLTAEEFMNWRAYFDLHPFGFMRDNIHSASIASIMANAHRGKNQKPFRLNDFLIMPKQDDGLPDVIKTMISMAKPKKQANG